MIERVLEQEQAIRVVLSADRKASHLLLSWQDLDVLKGINDALSPLSEFTDVANVRGEICDHLSYITSNESTKNSYFRGENR